MGRRPVALFLGIALWLTSGVASASANFPMVITQYLGLTCPQDPACTICHKTLSGGMGTVDKPFGQQLMMFGLSAGSVGGLRNALDLERMQGVDSDFDGDSDIAALIACRDPNQSAPAMVGTDDAGASTTEDGGSPVVVRRVANTATDLTPEYGCAIGHGADAEGAGAATAIAAMLVLSARRSRRNPRTSDRR